MATRWKKTLVHVQMPLWSSVLVDDAAFCASPASGARLALTGAYRLAVELATQRISFAALSAYEATDRPLAAQKQKRLFTGLSTPRTRLGIITRNWLLSPPLNVLVSKLKGSDGAASIHKYLFSDEASLLSDTPAVPKTNMARSPGAAESNRWSAER